MNRLFLVLGAVALMGSGCININVDVDADIPPELGVVIDGVEEELVMAEPSEDITVTEPLVGQAVPDRFLVQGEARVFEQTFNWRLTDVTSGESIEDFETTNARDIGLFGEFYYKIDIPEAYGDELLLEVFEYSAADGARVNTVTIPLVRE